MDPGEEGSHLKLQRPLVTFFLLTYALMWACFITVAVAGIPIYAPLGGVLVSLGTFAPSLVALWITARTEREGGVPALVGGVLRWRVPARWYLFALAYIPAIKLTAALDRKSVVQGRRGVP